MKGYYEIGVIREKESGDLKCHMTTLNICNIINEK